MSTEFHLPARVPDSLRARLQGIGAAQSGVVSRTQLRDVVSSHVIDAMLVANRWQERGPLVVVMHNGPLNRNQQLWAAVLSAGYPAGLAARTAAAEQGLKGWAEPAIEIVVPRGAVVPRNLGFGLKVHESRRFGPEDLHPGMALPQVRIERALIDAAAWTWSPRAACGVVAAGVQQRLTTADRLIVELAGAGAIRHRRLLERALGDIAGGAQAVSEIDFVHFCRRNGLPKPALQVVRPDAAGRRRYLDATLRGRAGRLVHVEIDGALHLVVGTYWNDMSRGNELMLSGTQVLRFPSFVIHANDQRAVDQIRRALDLSERGGAIAG